MGRASSADKRSQPRNGPGRRERGSALEGFAYVDRDFHEIYSPRGGELKTLRYTLHPDELADGLRHPEKLDQRHQQMVLQWVDLRSKAGFELVSVPTRARMTICLDPTEPAGSMWVMVSARFFHQGVQGVLTGDDMQEMKDYAAEIGAAKSKQPGVAEYLEKMTPEQAAATVQAMAPRKEIDDDDGYV